MKIGDRVSCVYSADSKTYTVDFLYSVMGFDVFGNPIIEDNFGVWRIIGDPLIPLIATFEKVDEEEQIRALIAILEMSREDVKAGRVMTLEEVRERLKKD